MISDINKAFCDLAHATYGKGWHNILPATGVTAPGRAGMLSKKHDADPFPAEVREMLRAAKEKQAEIAEAIDALISAHAETARKTAAVVAAAPTAQ